jgi:glycosyltransferase involved in cell wall biosynthesis
MKVLYLIARTVDAVHQNTTENELARSLRKLGHHIITLVGYENEKRPLDGFSAVEYIHIPHGSWRRKIVHHISLLQAVMRFRGDVVMFSFSLAHIIVLARLFCIRKYRPVLILDIRSVPVDVDSGLRGKILLARYSFSLKVANWLCDGLTTITPMLADTLRPLVPKVRDIGIWASGVNLDQFQKSGISYRKRLGLQGKQILFHHGIISANRGLQNAMRAFASLKDEYPDLIFLIVGDGEGLQELRSLANSFGIESRVVFTGQIDFEEIPYYLRSADIGILPFPNIEWWAVSSPIKLMEYLAMGVPVVATSIDANRIVLEKTMGGVLAADSSPQSLANSISKLLESGCDMPSEALLAETVSWDSQANHLVDYFSVVMRESPLRGI